MKKVNNQNLWNIELGSQESMNVPIWISDGFQQQSRRHSQNLNNDSFVGYPLLVLNASLGRKNILAILF